MLLTKTLVEQDVAGEVVLVAVIVYVPVALHMIETDPFPLASTVLCPTKHVDGVVVKLYVPLGVFDCITTLKYAFGT